MFLIRDRGESEEEVRLLPSHISKFHLRLPSAVLCSVVCSSCQSNPRLAVSVFLEYQVLKAVTGSVELAAQGVCEVYGTRRHVFR